LSDHDGPYFDEDDETSTAVRFESEVLDPLIKKWADEIALAIDANVQFSSECSS